MEREFSVEQEEFVDKVMVWLNNIKEQDIDIVKNTIRRCHAKGFSFCDTIRYCKHTEEVNPDLRENKALAVLNALERKYQDLNPQGANRGKSH